MAKFCWGCTRKLIEIKEIIPIATKTNEYFFQFFIHQLFRDNNLMLVNISRTVKYNVKPFQSRFRYLRRIFRTSLFTFLIFSVMISSIPYSAFGDGFTQENLPPASVGNRNVQLFIKLSPSIITSDTSQPRQIDMRLCDANTNERILQDSFFIPIKKHDQLLISDHIHIQTVELI